MIVYRQKPILQGALEVTNPTSTNANQYFGIANVSSDTFGPSVVVSTALAAADSIVFTTIRAAADVRSGTPLRASAAQAFLVSCISPGGFFRVEAVNSTACVGSYQVAWMLLNPRGV